MDINHSLVLDNINSPILVGIPIKDETGRIVDFDIAYTNEELKKAVGFVIKDKPRWSDFEADITSDVPWFKMAIDAIAGRFYPDAVYYSPSTQSWYKIDMRWLPEEKYVIVCFSNITSERVYYQKLKRSLITDPLTGFLNRSGFDDAFGITLETAHFSHTFAGILLIDIVKMLYC